MKKLTLDQPVTYRIKVPGEIDRSWLESAGDITLTSEGGVDSLPVTIITGTFDQAGLHGLLRRLYNLGLPLISVICLQVT